MRCPSCGSENCHIVEETQTNTKGFGLFKGCCGYIIFDRSDFYADCAAWVKAVQPEGHSGYVQAVAESSAYNHIPG
jgi:hypothetical protein